MSKDRNDGGRGLKKRIKPPSCKKLIRVIGERKRENRKKKIQRKGGEDRVARAVEEEGHFIKCSGAPFWEKSKSWGVENQGLKGRVRKKGKKGGGESLGNSFWDYWGIRKGGGMKEKAQGLRREGGEVGEGGGKSLRGNEGEGNKYLGKGHRGLKNQDFGGIWTERRKRSRRGRKNRKEEGGGDRRRKNC